MAIVVIYYKLCGFALLSDSLLSAKGWNTVRCSVGRSQQSVSAGITHTIYLAASRRGKIPFARKWWRIARCHFQPNCKTVSWCVGDSSSRIYYFFWLWPVPEKMPPSRPLRTPAGNQHGCYCGKHFSNRLGKGFSNNCPGTWRCCKDCKGLVHPYVGTVGAPWPRSPSRKSATLHSASTLKADGGAWKTLCAHNVSPFASFIQQHRTQSYHVEQGKRPIWMIECCEFIALVHAVQFWRRTHTSYWFYFQINIL